MTLPVDEILEDLGASRAEPGRGLLERLFLRFVERVPFESASKIRRNARVAETSDKPRMPDVFWKDRLEQGAGGTCFARVAAFDALLKELGFSTRRILGRVRHDFDHAALLVSIGGRDWIADVGFPLPALLPAAAGSTDTGMGGISVKESARGWSVALEDGVPAATRALELFRAEVDEAQYGACWENTFRPGALFLQKVILRRQLEARVVAFADGDIQIDDRHSRTRIPLAANRAPVLSELFGIDAVLLQEAFAIAGDPDPAAGSAEILVALEPGAGAERAWDLVRSPEGWGRMFDGVGEAATRRTGPSTWTAQIAGPPGGSAVSEEVEADDEKRSIRVRRASGASYWEVAELGGKTWLLRRMELDGPRLDLLRNDSMRGRLAGILALDLLAWSRRAAGMEPL